MVWIVLTLACVCVCPDTSHLCVEAALKTDLVDVLIGVLEKDKLDHLVDPSAAKVCVCCCRGW